MSGSGFFGPRGEDPKEIELVDSIIEKSKAGKIGWRRNTSSLVATLPSMQLSFVRSSLAADSLFGSFLSSIGVWDVFSVRKADGTELLKVEQPQVNPLLVGAGPPPSRSKLVQAVDTLYSIANAKAQGEIDNAIRAIKNL